MAAELRNAGVSGTVNLAAMFLPQFARSFFPESAENDWRILRLSVYKNVGCRRTHLLDGNLFKEKGRASGAGCAAVLLNA
jgi:hypothetical protein